MTLASQISVRRDFCPNRSSCTSCKLIWQVGMDDFSFGPFGKERAYHGLVIRCWSNGFTYKVVSCISEPRRIRRFIFEVQESDFTVSQMLASTLAMKVKSSTTKLVKNDTVSSRCGKPDILKDDSLLFKPQREYDQSRGYRHKQADEMANQRLSGSRKRRKLYY
jgi:hypothetical protein